MQRNQMLRRTLLLATLLCCFLGALAAAPAHTASSGDEVVVSLSSFATWLSATVQKDAAKHETTITAHGQTVILTNDSKKALVNGTPVLLPLPVIARKDVTLVPLHFLVSAFHATLSWNAKQTVATVTRPDIHKPLIIPIATPVPVVMVPKALVDFIHAVETGDLAGTRKSVTAHPRFVNASDASGMTPLLIAAVRGHANIVQYLLSCKADIHAMNVHKQTALHLASLSGSTECVTDLLAAGASPGARDFKDDLPLHFAATTKYVAVARVLLAQKIGLNAKDHDGDTPLRCAIKSKQPEMAAYLRSVGGTE